jgi:hypothetical protein
MSDLPHIHLCIVQLTGYVHSLGFNFMQHAGVRGAAWCPKRINLGSGQAYQTVWLNLDVAEHMHPDLLLDLSEPLTPPLSMVSATACPVRLEEGTVHHIEAANVFEHVAQLTTLMENCLRLLAVRGELRIEVPLEGSPTAWQGPTLVRTFNASSWISYTDYFCRWDWFEHRFEMGASTYLDSFGQRCPRERVASTRVALCKVETTARERTAALMFQTNLRLPDDEVLPHEISDVGSVEYKSAFENLWHEMLRTDQSLAATWH